MENQRKFPRHPFTCSVALSWRDNHGGSHHVQARGIDFSAGGASIETTEPLEVRASVYIRAAKYGLLGGATVRHCNRRGQVFVVGLEFAEDAKRTVRIAAQEFVDYYEALQISPNADFETIHRVYRIMASRFHPDNPESGDSEKFLLLNQAYAVLSDVSKRNQYDARHHTHRLEPVPVFEMKEFVDGVEGETNRRMGLLCLLYIRRRLDPEQPGLSLLQLETMMSFPREHLMFTIWYLKEKEFIRIEQNSDYVVTARGADYVESGLPANRILHRLLKSPGGATYDTWGVEEVSPESPTQTGTTIM
jgi:curved DNA-binding protein